MFNNKIDEYLETVHSSRSENTLKTYRNALLRFTEIVGDMPLNSDAYLKFLRATKDQPSSQLTYRTAVMGLYLYCSIDDDTINIAKLRQLDKQHAQRVGIRLPVFDREGIEKTIEYCASLGGDLLNLRDRAFVLVLADTGLRISEACALRRGDIDWNEGQAAIIGKGDKQAIVRFSNRSMRAMQDYLSARSELDGASGKPLTSLPVFVRHDKGAGKKVKPVKSGGMWYAVKGRMIEAGVDPKTIRIHDFRHYFVTMVQLAGGDIRITQELARHASITTTSRYAHIGGKADELYNQVFNERI